MNLDKKLIDKLVNITSSASIECYKYVGKNDKIIAEGLTKVRPGMKVKPIIK